ncbi:MAG: CpaD family pilus assembly protein [Candidatus Phaeomarinobacter sp.]
MRHLFRLPTLLAASLTLTVAACGNIQNGPLQAASVKQTHPITVDSQSAALMLRVAPDSTSLSDDDVSRLKAYALRYRNRGNGPMVMSIPTGAPNRGAASRAAAEVETLLDSLAIGPNSLRLSHYRASGAASDAPLILSFSQYVATPSPCGNWSEDAAYNPNNTRSANFGCASQNNLAVMLADPGDLEAPRDMTPGDAQRRDVVLERYRLGETTQTERGEEESGAASQVSED